MRWWMVAKGVGPWCRRLRLARRDVIARVQVTNLFNIYRWIAGSSEGLTYHSGRYVGFSLATDLES